ncbi:MAG: hypothetical protein AABY09_03850 [Nanoarchaeota archaeon]
MAGYITLYMYSTSNGEKNFKLTSDACHELGGKCRSSCNSNEIQKIKCDDMVCCVEAYPASPEDRIYYNDALAMKDISYCNKVIDEEMKASCKLKVELANLKPDYVNCVKLTESECLKAKQCIPIYFTPSCAGCSGKKFEICMPDNDKFCEDTLGEWNALDEKCNCSGKAWFDSYGCYGCDVFKEESSIMECERRLA